MKFTQKLKKLRVSIFLYFFVFTVLLIFLIWLLQTVFFESNYQRTRAETMSSYADIIESSIVTNGLIDENAVITLKESGIDTVVVKKVLNKIDVLYPTNEDVTLADDKIYYELYSSIINKIDIENKHAISGEITLDSNHPYIYTARKMGFSNSETYLILYCHMNSVSDAVKVLKFQLTTIAMAVIVISGFISWIISERISRPVNKMSDVAVRWAKGEDNVEFQTGGEYAEIDQLALSLNYAKEEISKTGKLQRDLLANVSHDLKTPLTMIKAYAEMIKDISGENKEKRDKHTKVIIEEADRLTLLVNDILNLSRLQSSVAIFEKTTFNLSELTEGVLYKFDNVMSTKGYVIEKYIDNDIFVYGDEKRIEEVIYNLVGNSINYTGEDKTIKVYLKKSNKLAVLEILDSGKGIDKENISTIWEKYYRFSETHHRAVKGTGLGLSIVKTILDNHNLKYGVISKPNVGSNFYVEFELVKDN